MTSKQIRQKFLDFFENKGHKIVHSAPIVLKDDPSLMFSNSGMTQFKDFFLGYKEPYSLRIADTQKCLRVSGKHNDLDDVGRDTYHHTMFEMLGNWSFGDYFKKEAIAWAWELLTEVYKIPKENLYVTVFDGDESDNLERDKEAYDFWKEHITEDRILGGNKKDNFWEMGDTGPCGPCSEIHIDLRNAEEKTKISGKDLVNKDHPQVVEIWNLVFMEFLRKSDKSLEKLPKQNVDTGMGFERLCMALQGKESNYDTDIFTPIISKIEEISGKKYTSILNDEKDIAIRVVADHIRAVAFVIADGQLPSNTGAGYVIRRILRRAISYSYRFLDLKKPFIFQLVKILKEQMIEIFPEIESQEKLITEVIKEEENSFLKTIEQGLVKLESVLASTISNKEKIVSGQQIFDLYDTYGFPADLSRIIAEEKGLSIDEIGFEIQMQEQKKRSKKSSLSKVYDWVILNDKPETFVGYDLTENKVKITRYRKIETKDGEFYQIVLDETPFYAEGGGQVGDTGVLEGYNETINILDTKKENNLIVSIIPNLPNNPQENFTAKVDINRRKNIQSNHSATHLLQEALKNVLGKHVEQKGSFVCEDYLRFDFSHFGKITEEELEKVENQINEKIQSNIDLKEYRNIPIQEALDRGATALFGEKYGENVRLIEFGTSRELCGGTHVKNTNEILVFRIVSEGSQAAGIRRIEAITGNNVLEHFKETEKTLNTLTKIVKSKDLIKSIQKIVEENQSLKADIEQLKSEKVKEEIKRWKTEYNESNGKNILVKRTSLDNSVIKNIIFQLKKEIKNSVTIILSDSDGKPAISIGISDDTSNKYNATEMVRILAKEINGGGTAGGKNLNGLDSAFKLAEKL